MVGPYLHLRMRARLHIMAVNRSLLDYNWRVIPLMPTISSMKSFILSVSVKPGTVFSFYQVAWVHSVHIHG